MITNVKLVLICLAAAVLLGGGTAFAEDDEQRGSFPNRSSHYGIPSASSSNVVSSTECRESSESESSSAESGDDASASSHRGTQSRGFSPHRHERLSNQIVSDIRLDPGPDQWHVTWPGGFIIGDTSARWPRVPWYSYPRSRTFVLRRGFQYRQPCNWVPGRYERREERVYRPGYWTQHYVPPAYEIRHVNGQPTRVQVREGYYEDVYVSGQYVTRPQRVWVPGRWDCAPGCWRH